MLTLRNIYKEYETGDAPVQALDGVSVEFRDSEFVAILGQSGCGKTTLLNIIGGLDSYTSGDLIIDGVSTRRFKPAQWDAYRNHSVGFVFQSYNLIPHQTVASNVELALKLSKGVSAQERHRRVSEALAAVGLADQASKKPTMMSGGQMQRVAIARALVNDPQIVLADEPTGALDSKTSVQVMDILKDVSKDRLVIMVTHNPELAEQYASRIIRLSDGVVVDDSNPVTDEERGEATGELPKSTRLSLSTALGLSLRNLMTKKGRTLLTSFAGAIGIAGIALILSMSNGVSEYISGVERDTMGNYPIRLSRETYSFDISEDDGFRLGDDPEERVHELEAIYSRNIVADSVEQQESLVVTNDLGAFKKYLDAHGDELDGSLRAVEYGYGITPKVYRLDDKDKVTQTSPSTLLADEMEDYSYMMGGVSMMTLGASTGTAWQELPTDADLRDAGYDVIEGRWPASAEEAVLVVTKDNEVSDYVLYTLGLMDMDHLDAVVKAARDGRRIDDPQERIEYGDVIGLRFSVLSPSQLYRKNDDGVWYDASDEKGFLRKAYDKGIPVEIVGIVRMKDGAMLGSGVAYDARLTRRLMDVAADSDVVKAQLKDEGTNVLTGKKFEDKESRKLSLSAGDGDDSDGKAKVAADVVSPVLTRAATLMAEVVPGDGSDAQEGTGDEETSDADIPTYEIEFVNYDGSPLAVARDYAAGEEVEIPTVVPERPADVAHEYVFIGWTSVSNDPAIDGRHYESDSIPPASGDVAYVATYYAIPVSGPDDGDEQPGAGLPTVPGLPEGLDQMSPEDIAKALGIDASELAGLSQADVSSLLGAAGGLPSGYDLSGIDLSDYATLMGAGAMPSLSDLSDEEMAALMGYDLSSLTGAAGLSLSDGQLQALLAEMSDATPDTYQKVLDALGYATQDQPTSISLYPSDFEGKSAVEDFIADYNRRSAESEQVTYTDLVGLMVSEITSIVDTISAVLIAFVAISLVVSSIMIAIITYISVLERTKEIGILRALGASKGDVSKIFNAETLIEGLLAGLIGVGTTAFLCIPINAVISNMIDVENIASLPAAAAGILVGISVALTTAAGFVPSRMASKKDPAVALRSE